MRKLFPIACACLSVACAEMESASLRDALSQVDTGLKVGESTRPLCERDYDEFEADAHVLGFEIHGKKGISLGFNPGGVFRFFGLGFKTETGLMSMSMSLSETIQPTQTVAYVTGSGKSKKKEFRFDLGIDQFGIGLDYFKQTPLAALSEKTVRSALFNLEKELEEAGARWKTKVAYTEGLRAVIPVGGVSGVRPGDLFYIYNVEYIWADRNAPCDSELLMVIPTTVEPLAEAQAIRVENNATMLRIESLNSDEPIQVGAIVEIGRLAGDPKEAANRRLHRPVRVRQVQSQPLVLRDDLSLDLSVVVGEQMRAVMDDYHFYPKN